MKSVSLPILHEVPKQALVDLYCKKRNSVAQISRLLGFSQNKINYWIEKHKIEKRTISDAMYQFKNPKGDPFKLSYPKTVDEGILFGLGLGLYWGEGSKKGGGGLKITNTDPKLIRKYIDFLESFLDIDRNKLRFSLLIFRDISENNALEFWSRELNIKKQQFYKASVIKVRGEGTYKNRSEHGVAILQFNNVKLKRLICDMIENI